LGGRNWNPTQQTPACWVIGEMPRAGFVDKLSSMGVISEQNPPLQGNLPSWCMSFIGYNPDIAIQNTVLVRIYLDNCAFNRPFDDQSQIRIRLEAEAKLYLQDKIKQGALELIWSYILEFENEANPFLERKAAIRKWHSLAVVEIEENASVLKIAKNLLKKGVKAKDALHVASAIEGCADYFVTTDDRLLKKLFDLTVVQVINPVDIIVLIDGYVN